MPGSISGTWDTAAIKTDKIPVLKELVKIRLGFCTEAEDELMLIIDVSNMPIEDESSYL